MKIWKKIFWAQDYEVSNFGEIRSWKPIRNFAKKPTKPRHLKLLTDRYGYYKAVLYVNKKPFNVLISTLVAEAWHGPRPQNYVVRHLDGNRKNNIPENLKWGTPKENSEDAKKHKTWCHGTKVHTSKLTEKKVLEILNSSLSHTELAKKFNVTIGAIWHVRNRRSWKHIEISTKLST